MVQANVISSHLTNPATMCLFPLKMVPYSYFSCTVSTNVIKLWGGISRTLVSAKPFVSSTSWSKLTQKTPICEQLLSSSLFNAKWQLWEWQKEFILGGFVRLESGRRSIFNSTRWTESKNVCRGFKRTGFDLLSLPPFKTSPSLSQTQSLSHSLLVSQAMQSFCEAISAIRQQLHTWLYNR